MSYLCMRGHRHRDPQRAVDCVTCRRQDRRPRLSPAQRDAAALQAAIRRLFDLHRGGNDPNPQYAQLTRQIIRRANGAFKRQFGRATGATQRSRS